LGAYIVDLTCVLHCLFIETLHTKSPIALSEDLISHVVENYEKIDSYRVHNLVRDMNFIHRFEDQIAELIRKYTSPAQATNALQTPSRRQTIRSTKPNQPENKCIVM
jgi:hypothetical protein